MVWGIGCGVSMIVFGLEKKRKLWKRGIQRYIFHKYTMMAAGIITVFAILVSLGNSLISTFSGTITCTINNCSNTLVSN